MHTEFIDFLGLVAGTLTTIAFLPQLYKTWKSRISSRRFVGDDDYLLYRCFPLVDLWTGNSCHTGNCGKCRHLNFGVINITS